MQKNRNKDLVRNLLSDVFDFAEHQEKGTYDFGYRKLVTKKCNVAALNKAPGVADAENIMSSIDLYVPHYTPSTSQQGIIP